jgi:hypothetical protein
MAFLFRLCQFRIAPIFAKHGRNVVKQEVCEVFPFIRVVQFVPDRNESGALKFRRNLRPNVTVSDTSFPLGSLMFSKLAQCLLYNLGRGLSQTVRWGGTEEAALLEFASASTRAGLIPANLFQVWDTPQNDGGFSAFGHAGSVALSSFARYNSHE